MATIDEVTAPATVARIRAMLVQMKESLESWSDASSIYLADELQGLAVFQTEFVKDQLERVLPKGAVGVNTVKISPNFAQGVVFTDPTEINILTLPTDLESTVQRTFSLTAAKGSAITLPSGEVVAKAFRGISTKQAELILSRS